jgi:hypothetical protein
MKNQAASPREQWRALVAGQDPGPMVSPLCDNWSLDIAYFWPYPEPDPFPPGHRQHGLSQQMAMAKVCGWTPSFLAGIPFHPRNRELLPDVASSTAGGVTRTETRIHTPHGDLTSVIEQGVSNRTAKPMLTTEEDYRRMEWHVRATADYDEDAAIAEGRALARAVGDRGVLGTWWGAPMMACDRDNLWYHLADWPDACEALRVAVRETHMLRLETLRKAGFDYLFYCADGTEWVSPGFFRETILPDTLAILKHWRSLGGWVLWHSCGKVKALVEQGVYNECLPDVFETLSEPPVGDLPSLAWARERLDRRIATKGNVPLGTLLNGTEAEVRAAVARVREQTRGWRHIVGLTDDVLAGTPLRNARAFVNEALRG